METIQVKIANKEYKLKVAETEEEKEKGLQNVKSMESDEGMLFDYSDDPQESISFWMKDTLIPLDIIFINKKGTVISVAKGEPLSEEAIIEDSEPVSVVIELNQNSGVKKGDNTDLFSDPDENEDAEDEYPDVKVNKLNIYASDGSVQAVLQGGERIFSRKSTKVIIRKAKRAFSTKLDKDYKSLGRYVFNEMRAQDERPPEYT